MTGTYALPVTFEIEPSGRMQLLRTGSGFWRWDHGARFSIDEPLLDLILRNTKLRARCLRVDYMHYANGDLADDIDELRKAGEIDPAWIYKMPWPDPATGAPAFGLFSPCVWEIDAAATGLDEISPVIQWEYALPWDALDPDTGEIIPAGTEIGPTITGVSLVDQGFFWMDKVRFYSAHGARLVASLYQEYTMLLTPEQLAALITWMTEQGIAPEVQTQVIAELTAQDADDAVPPAAPDMAAGADPAQAAQVMAARAAFIKAASSGRQADITAAHTVYLAALQKKTPAKAKHPLAGLLASATAAKKAAAQVPPKTTIATQPPSQGAVTYSDLEAQLKAQKEITDQLMMKELDREGLLVGIDDPMELYHAAPDYFMKKVQSNIPLAGATSPAGSGRSALREVKSADNDGERHHQAVNLYRQEQAKAGRKLSYEAALLEWSEIEEKKQRKASL